MSYQDRVDFSTIEGKVFDKVYEDDDRIFFKNKDETFVMLHNQDCCEYVTVDDICGDLSDLVGATILVAEEASNDTKANPLDPNQDIQKQEFWETLSKPIPEDTYEDSATWTFYKLQSTKGHVTIRWYGSSNGYYSESVDFEKW